MRTFLLAGVATALFFAMPAAAQNAAETKAITASLDTTQRINRQTGTAIDPETAGYYQLVVEPDGFTRAALCPLDRAERNRLAEASNTLFNWALRKKRNWGATAHLFFNRDSVNYADPNLKPDALIKFFAVYQPDKDPAKCKTPEVDFSTYYSQLFPVSSSGIARPVHLELVTWYNKQADQAQIDLIPVIAGALLTSVGLPGGLLGTAAELFGTTPEKEITELLNEEDTSKARTTLHPGQPANIKMLAYLGLREPTAGDPLSKQAQATFTLQPVSSIFSPTSPTFVSLAEKAPNDILYLIVPPAVAGGASRYLFQVLAPNADYDGMVKAGTYDVLSNRCASLDLHLRDTLQLSRVDAAVVLHAIAVQVGQSNLALSEIGRIPCIKDRETLLGKVGIKLPIIDPLELPPPAGQARMRTAMLDIGTLIARAPDETSSSLWSAVASPLRVFDGLNTFPWAGQEEVFDASNRAQFQSLLRQHVKQFGCMVYFPEPPVVFTAIGPSVGVGNPSPVRKSAALAQLADGSVAVMQFLYGGGGDAAQIKGISFVSRDDPAKEKMLQQEACRPGAGREWMQAFLRPPAVEPAQAPVVPDQPG